MTSIQHLSVHGHYIGVAEGSSDGWTLAPYKEPRLESLRGQTFPSQEALLTAIDEDAVVPATWLKNCLVLHAKRLMWGSKADEILNSEEMGVLAMELYDLADYVSRKFLGETLEKARRHWRPRRDQKQGQP
jgi:hypothetical protein